MIETKQMSVPAHKEAATPSQLRRLWGMLGDGLDQGGIGIGAGIVYTPGANHTAFCADCPAGQYSRGPSLSLFEE